MLKFIANQNKIRYDNSNFELLKKYIYENHDNFNLEYFVNLIMYVL